jgi:hypothetical protein
MAALPVRRLCVHPVVEAIQDEAAGREGAAKIKSQRPLLSVETAFHFLFMDPGSIPASLRCFANAFAAVDRALAVSASC